MNTRNGSAVLFISLSLVQFIGFCWAGGVDSSVSYPIVDTGQSNFFGNHERITSPQEGSQFYGQDSHYAGNQLSYRDNSDGTVTDLNTGLMWQLDPGEKMTYEEAVSGADSFNLAGYDDWRLPSIKELYSLIDFSGQDPSGLSGDTSEFAPFIDPDYFVFSYGDESESDRIIDSQYATTTRYVGSSEFGGGNLMFGVNFADGRIKGYPTGPMPGQSSGKLFYVMYIRGNEEYGTNNYVDDGDGTVTDLATGLMWQQDDSGEGMNWEDSLLYAESLELAGYDDWRLPNAKELQSIVDYSRSLDTHDSAAIDPVFSSTRITDEGGNGNYPFYWSSTTHENMEYGTRAVYVAFGEALGWFRDPTGNYQLMDVHGAGAQRSDPKTGDPDDYQYGHGPQGDVIRINNFVRCVRDALNVEASTVDEPEPEPEPEPDPEPEFPPLPPLPPILSYLTITPAEVESGNEVTIGLDIENIDSQSFTYIVTIQIGELTLLVDVELGAYESKTVSRTITPDMVGVFNVTVDGMTGSFTVGHAPLPAEFVVSELEISPEFGFDTPFEMGEFVIITVLVKNIDEKEGSYTVEWKVDGATIDTQNVTLAAGSSRHARAYFEAQSPGTYQVSVEGLTETFIVRAPLEPAEFTVSDLIISREEIEEGEGVAIFVEVMNIGEEEGFYTLEIEIDGIVTERVEVTLDGGESTTVTFMGGGAIGDHMVAIGELSGSFTVNPKPSFWDKIPGFPYESIILGLISVIIIIWYARVR